MGVLILVLATILTAELVRRAVQSWQEDASGVAAVPALEQGVLPTPAGGTLVEVTATSSRAVLWFRLGDGAGHQLMFVNPRTAEVTGTLIIGAE